MKDKNGVEMKTGMIVKITGAYFKNDNGLYFVSNSPGDVNWLGNDYSLRKIGKTGKVSKSKYNVCFWPISIYTNDRMKRMEGNEWNKKHAEIEVVYDVTNQYVKEYFIDEMEILNTDIENLSWRFGDEHWQVKNLVNKRDFYENVVAGL